MAAIDDINNLVRAGKKTEAIAQLAGLIRSDLNNCSLWLLMAELVDDPARKQDCYRRVLALEPGNQKACEFLDRMQLVQTPDIPLPRPVPAIKTEPNTRPRQPLPTASTASPTHLESHQAPLETARNISSANSNSLEHSPSFTVGERMKRYKLWWWLFILLLLVSVAWVWINAVDPHSYEHESAFYTPENTIIDQAYSIGRGSIIFAGILLSGIWVIKGLVGGIILTNKKLRGMSWAWMLFLFPLVLYLAYLAFMGILGEFAFALGINASYTRKKCPQCQSWIPWEATRCQKCGQVVPVVIS